MGETERGETRRRASGGSTELLAAMATAAAFTSLGALDARERERATESERDGRRTRLL